MDCERKGTRITPLGLGKNSVRRKAFSVTMLLRLYTLAAPSIAPSTHAAESHSKMRACHDLRAMIATSGQTASAYSTNPQLQPGLAFTLS